MLSGLKNFLSFNATERNGIIVLLILNISIAFVPRLFQYYRKEKKWDSSKFVNEIEAFEKNLVIDSIHQEVRNKIQPDINKMEKGPAAVSLFPFNPNGLSPEKWKLLGLKDWQIKVIMNYESKGGKFYTKKDLEKIYGISKEEFSLLEPFILLPEKPEMTAPENIAPSKTQYKSIIVDLNTADSATLLELRGIGPSFAKRILKYRELLGGYYCKEQLLEVYGFDSQRYEQVSPYCIIGDGPFRKLNLNLATTAELKKHPYLDYYIAKAIVDRRITKGNFTSVALIKELPLITDEIYNKMKAYFTIQ